MKRNTWFDNKNKSLVNQTLRTQSKRGGFNMNRRDFINKAGIVIGGTALSGGITLASMDALAKSVTNKEGGSIIRDSKRVDVHHHLIPPFWAAKLYAHGGDPSGWKLPKWSPESDIEYMDKLGIKTAMLALTAPGISAWKKDEAVDMARKINEYAAGLVSQYPGRFGNFIVLPTQDIDASLKEIEYGFDTLKADGVVLLSNYDGVYLGEPRFDPILAELNSRSAFVFVHPGKPKIELVPGVVGPVLDYPFDTTRAALSLIANGATSRYKNLKFSLSHAGGFLPYGAHRFSQLLGMLNKVKPESLIEEMQNFYFDTALASSPTSLPSLLAFAKPSHILYGSDIPYAGDAPTEWFTKNLDIYNGFAKGVLKSINRKSAEVLFPRLKMKA